MPVSEKLLILKPEKSTNSILSEIPNQIIYIIGLGNKADYGYEAQRMPRGCGLPPGKELIVDFDSFLGELEPGEVARRFAVPWRTTTMFTTN